MSPQSGLYVDDPVRVFGELRTQLRGDPVSGTAINSLRHLVAVRVQFIFGQPGGAFSSGVKRVHQPAWAILGEVEAHVGVGCVVVAVVGEGSGGHGVSLLWNGLVCNIGSMGSRPEGQITDRGLLFSERV